MRKFSYFKTTVVMILPLLFMSCGNEVIIEDPEPPETIIEEKDDDSTEEEKEDSTTEEEEEIGSGAPRFPELVNFNLNGGRLTIHSEKKADRWYFSNFRLHNDSVVNLEYLKAQKEIFPDWTFLQNIEVTTGVHERDVVKVKTDWFSLYKIDNKTMDITVEPSEEARQFKLYVSNNRDAGMYITVVQKDERN